MKTFDADLIADPLTGGHWLCEVDVKTAFRQFNPLHFKRRVPLVEGDDFNHGITRCPTTTDRTNPKPAFLIKSG